MKEKKVRNVKIRETIDTCVAHMALLGCYLSLLVYILKPSFLYSMLFFFIPSIAVFFFFNDTATTEIYTLSLHDALPICALLRLPTLDAPQIGAALFGSEA